MSKTFGYSGQSGRDWFNSNAYSDQNIDSIPDPQGGNGTNLPTAIPSPFARIDLVKTAFKNITRSPNLKAQIGNQNGSASALDAKLVAHTLDLAEILFNFDTLKDPVQIIVWDQQLEISNLLNSPYSGHRKLGEALQLYLTQDSKANNFDSLRALYLIKYKHQIIGCTSPTTLFFATGDDLENAQFSITQQHKTFDGSDMPLYSRDAAFQKYLYLLFKANPILSTKLKVVDDYLKKNLEILRKENYSLFDEILNLDASSYHNDYDPLYTGVTGNQIEIFGIGLRKRKLVDLINEIENSDFIIQTSKYQGRLKPLVLQNNFNRSLKYVKDDWDPRTEVPIIDPETVLEKRRLPSLNHQYPYLTVNDFLEPNLIKLVYPICKEKFFDVIGSNTTHSENPDNGYVLPVKKLFFDFFNTEDLISSSPNKPQLELREFGKTVKAILKIPISKQGEFISFERTYYTDGVDDQNRIVEHAFGLTIFPFCKIDIPNYHPFYRIQLIDRDLAGLTAEADYSLRFYSNENMREVEYRARKIRSVKNSKEQQIGSQYYILNKDFDFIEINNAIASGIIIPQWKIYSGGNKQFSFAVDFGTTNTHIEYQIDKGYPVPFDINTHDEQIASLFDPDNKNSDKSFHTKNTIEIPKSIDYEFVPRHIGGNSSNSYKFPHRTVIAENEKINLVQETFTLADFNIPFYYEKLKSKPGDKLTANLKWAKNDAEDEKRIRAYFEQIIMLMRNKVIMNNGNLAATKLIWFYPSSMTNHRKDLLEATWQELFKEYFQPTEQAVGIVESLAPFYYYQEQGLLQGGISNPVISIDIGGGTSDIVVFQKNAPLFITSFRFAANTIFGDGLSQQGAESSGFIKKYYPIFKNLLNKNEFSELEDILDSLVSKKRAEDLNTFFFSLENNPTITDQKTFSYNSLLSKDQHLKIIFLYFYTAIIYHIADMMHQNQIALPKHIIFSGTGSKLLNIITPKNSTLAQLSKRIFEHVYASNFNDYDLTIKTDIDKPKEITCKGGLIGPTQNMVIDVHNLKRASSCIEGVEHLTYGQLNDQNKSEIIIKVNAFIDFFLNLTNQMDFTEHFGVSQESITIFTEACKKDLPHHLDAGLKNNEMVNRPGSENKTLEETLFFYPLIGSMQIIAQELAGI